MGNVPSKFDYCIKQSVQMCFCSVREITCLYIHNFVCSLQECVGVLFIRNILTYYSLFNE